MSGLRDIFMGGKEAIIEDSVTLMELQWVPRVQTLSET